MFGGITYLRLAQGASAPEPGLRMLALVVGMMVTALVSGAAISRGGDVRGEFPSRGSFGVTVFGTIYAGNLPPRPNVSPMWTRLGRRSVCSRSVAAVDARQRRGNRNRGGTGLHGLHRRNRDAADQQQ
ncbi:hypothetical protein [Amycolatopsis thermophila]|uniref:Uncharacterized protein n=1 Tax=Amycolatopsis thermophila TaxID=206084 RepID=A0ABU0EQV1_9PSEU|nr:hypothetical protein [Amycolatopsis thermophila]MDQ0377675.1 hypothetical protein [Amycolatopsis thermophila]